MDHHVGRILTTVTEMGLREETIFAFTADHGETMVEHGTYFAHCYHVWEAILQVPLLIARPGGPSRRVELPVSGVDLTPSLIRYATGEAATEGRFDGVSYEERGPEDVIRLEAQHLPSVGRGHVLATVQGRKKWFAEKHPNDDLSEWFVDLERDPSESSRAPWIESNGANYLRAWNNAEGSYESRSAEERPPTEPEIEKALRALGYLE